MAALMITVSGWTQSPARFIQYDPAVLRIPGKSLPIGIVTLSGNGDTLQTSGFLDGKDGWGKYKLEVDGCSYSNGHINIKGNSDYKKSDSITISVYTRKWFFGWER